MSSRGWWAAAVVVLVAAAACSTAERAGGADRAPDGPVATRPAPPAAGPAPSTAAPGTGALARYAAHRSAGYEDPARWLCRPERGGDPCDEDLDATVVEPDGSTRVERFEPHPDPPVDCFYVYPTVSGDPTPTSDLSPGPGEEDFVVVNQAARLQSVCRLFVPLYRQITTTALRGAVRADAPGAADPYADVLDSFRTYMARDNHGRGVVLVGHSQGTVWLNRLLREEVDPNPDVRGRLVGAYLAGGRVGVPAGALVGGDLADIPICSADGEVGCVTTWSSVLPAAPPLPAGRDAPGCANPSAIGGTGTAQPYFTTGAAIAIGRAVDGEDRWAGLAATPPATPFVQLPGRFRTTCRTEPGGSRLEVAWTDDPAASTMLPGGRGADLHLLDVNLVMGDVVRQVRLQAERFEG